MLPSTPAHVPLPRRGLVILAAATSVAAIGLALPYAASGRRWRSAYELLRLVRALGIASGPSAGLFVSCVALVPVLAASVWVAIALHARRAAVSLAAAASALTLSTGVAVARSPLRLGFGFRLATLASVVTLLGVSTLAVHDYRARRPSRT